MAGNDDSGLRVSIEPFDPARHDRTAFSCGAARIDNFLKRTARKHQHGDFTRIWVAVGSDAPRVLGYYAINSHAIEGVDLPIALTRNAPRHGAVPAAYFSTFGVDVSVQGRGLGRVLLIDALKRIANVSQQIGIAVVVLDILDDDGDAAKRVRFYERFGFTSFPSRPLRMFISIRLVRDTLVQ